MVLGKFKKAYPRAHKVLTTIGGVAKTAYKAYGLATTIASLINVERKHLDKKSDGVYISTTASLSVLNDMAQGTSDITRVGNSVLSKSIQGKGLVYWNTAASGPEVLRVMVFRDAENTDGTPPAISEVLEETSSPAVMSSPLNIRNTQRFHIIFDKNYILDQYHPMFKFKFFNQFPVLKDKMGRRIKGIHAKYNAGTTSAWAEGALWIMVVSNAATNGPGISWYTRYRFIDN